MLELEMEMITMRRMKEQNEKITVLNFESSSICEIQTLRIDYPNKSFNQYEANNSGLQTKRKGIIWNRNSNH